MEHCKKNDNACDNKGLSGSTNVDGIVLGTSDNDGSDNIDVIDIDNLVEGINKMGIDMSKLVRAVIISKYAHHVSQLNTAMQNVGMHIDQNTRRNAKNLLLNESCKIQSGI